MSTFNQNSGTAVPTLINSSSVLVTGNAASANALTVRQFGGGNVFSAQTTTGSTALFVGANGNVGVGTTNPQYPLDVNGQIRSVYPILADSTATGSNYSIMRMTTGGDGNNYIQSAAAQTGGSTANLIFSGWFGGGESMRITSAGRVGIGVATPAAPLTAYMAAGGSRIAGLGSGDVYMTLGQDGTGGTNGSYIQCYAGGSSTAIGTTAYRLLLQPYGSSVIIGGAADNGNRLQVNGISNFTGNVGIGTPSPGYIFEVSNSTASTSTSFLGLTNPYVFGFNTGLNIGSSIVYSSRWQGDGVSGVVEMCKIDGRKENSANYGDSYLAFQTRYETNRGLGGAGTLTEKMRISGNGNIGIGTTNPTNLLHLHATGAAFQTTTGGIILQRSDVNTAWIIAGPDTGNTLRIVNNAAQGVQLVNGTTSWAAFSDSRLKNIIEPISNAITKVDSLNAVLYSWKSDDTNASHPGLIAQDVLEVQPEAVSEGVDGMLSVRYTELIPLAFAAIKELSAQNKALEARLAALEQSLEGTIGSRLGA
jgi:hypothetical protein